MPRRGESQHAKQGSGPSIHGIDGSAQENRSHIAIIILTNLLCKEFYLPLDAKVSVNALKDGIDSTGRQSCDRVCTKK